MGKATGRTRINRRLVDMSASVEDPELAETDDPLFEDDVDVRDMQPTRWALGDDYAAIVSMKVDTFDTIRYFAFMFGRETVDGHFDELLRIDPSHYVLHVHDFRTDPPSRQDVMPVEQLSDMQRAYTRANELFWEQVHAVMEGR